MGIDQNFKGEGEIKGGLFIDGRDKSGIACQFIERNFDDWAPVAELPYEARCRFLSFSNPILGLPSIMLFFLFFTLTSFSSTG